MASIHDLIPWRDTRSVGNDSLYDTLRQIQREMDSLFQGAYAPPGRSLPATRDTQAVFAPSLDIAEDEASYHMTLELPGVVDQDVDLTISDGVLTIRGEKKSAVERDDKKNWHRVERFYGTFQRSVSLPKEVDEANIAATFSNGVLDISIPKSVEKKEKTRKIEVKSA